jgi:hypothetical protein
MSDQMKSVMCTLWLVFSGIYFLQGAATGSLRKRRGRSADAVWPIPNWARLVCAFSSLVPSGQPQFLFLSVHFPSESKTFFLDAQKSQKSRQQSQRVAGPPEIPPWSRNDSKGLSESTAPAVESGENMLDSSWQAQL